MSDLDLGALFSTMGSILLAMLIFAIGLIPIGALALFAAWIACFQERAHFFEPKLPRNNTFFGFMILFGMAHVFTTFIMAMTWGVEGGASSLAVVTYSVASVVTVTMGLTLGALMLMSIWHLVQKKFSNAPGSGQSGSYRPVATTTNDHELESGSRNADDNTEATTKA